MPDTRLTDLTQLTTPASDDWTYIVDKSDTTDNAAGSSRKITLSDVMTIIKYDLISALTSSEVAITGTVTLDSTAFGKLHKISGTSADYAITLPSVSSNGGKIIGFRVLGAASASKLYTLTRAGSATIDGATTRVMWAGEDAFLYCDGTDWFKLFGKSNAMSCKISNNKSSGSYTAFPRTSVTTVDMDTTDIDNVGTMADLTNNRITCRRAAPYIITGAIVGTGANDGTAGFTGNATRCFVNVGGQVQQEISVLNGGYPGPMGAATFAATAGTNYELTAYHNVVGTDQFFYGAKTCYIAMLEVPDW